MSKILTQNAFIQCPHGGIGQSNPIIQPPKAYIEGGAILLDGDRGDIAGCTNLPFLCLTYTLVSMKLNSVTVDGRNVMLVTDFVQSNFGFPLTIQENHSVFDNTTPAPLPDGDIPAIPRELREDDQPQVSVTPESLEVSLAAAQPGVLLPFEFTLQSEFPRQWSLLDNNTGDITYGAGADILVTPAGGNWVSSPLTVTMSISGTYVSELSPGEHGFFLTAINHRGLWAMAEAKLTVTP